MIMITLARKPLSEPNVALNVLVHDTGALNIDASRVAGPPSSGGSTSGSTALGQNTGWNAHANRPTGIDRSMVAGRWPANIILQHLPGCQRLGLRDIQPTEGYRKNPVVKQSDGQIQFTIKKEGYQKISYTNAEGKETIQEWSCVAGCPIQDLDKGTPPPQGGGPSRYFKHLLG